MRTLPLALMLALSLGARAAAQDFDDDDLFAPPSEGSGAEVEAPTSLEPARLERGRAAMQAFFAPDLGGFVAMLAPPNGPRRRQRIEGLRDKLSAHEGLAYTVVEERAAALDGRPAFAATLRSTRTGEAYELLASFGPRGRITAFKLRLSRKLAAQSPYLDYSTRNALRLPFGGTWQVMWGGRTIAQNYHAAFANQRFAYDFNIVQGGASHRGDPHQNTSYFAFGQPVLAPAAGTVVEVVDGIADNAPPQRNTKSLTGNHVVLGLGRGEFALLGHLKDGSVRVRAGDRVAAGALLGLCGNSGNSSQPHLHFQLMRSADFATTQSLPAQFLGYRADGQAVARGEPVRGQRVAMP